MTTLTELMRSPALLALSLSLLHFVWQGALVALVLRAALARLRSAPASVRYLCASAALLSMALIFIATFYLTRHELTMVAPHTTVDTAVIADPRPWTLPLGAVESARSAESLPTMTSALALALVAWWVGASTMLLRLTVGWLQAHRMFRVDGCVIPSRIAEAATRLSNGLGIIRRVRIVQSQANTAPITMGWIRPVILMPTTLITRLSSSEIEALLAHELAHIRRHDYAINLLQSVIESLLFFHPAVHWTSRRIREERERCCDDTVIAVLGDSLTYARALTMAEEYRTESLRFGLASNGGTLMSRIERLLQPEARPNGQRKGTWALATAIPVVTLGLIATLMVACASTGSTGATQSAAAKVASVSIPWLPQQVARWTPQITSAADAHHVDPELLAILMLVESRGNPAARSRGNALGLMQILPDTARAIAAQRGLPAPTEEQLVEPALNLDFGAWYLARQIEGFGAPNDAERSISMAAAAYNGGPKRLRLHLTEGTALSDETMRYRATVLGLWRDRHASRSSTLDAMASFGN